MARTREQLDNARRLHDATAGLDFCLDVFGDHLAQRENYRSVDGLDAVRFHLMQRHHWTPAQVRAMSPEDLRFALSEEMHGWTLPAAAR